MTTPQPAPSATNASPLQEIPPFGEGYRDARKLYTLISGLLFGWELIGLELAPEPIQSVKLTLKSPQAVPYVLIVLLFYFGFRFTIEWYQTTESRRLMPSSRIDFTASHLIAIGALALYLTQTLLKIQLANQGDLLPSCLGGFLIITGSYACWRKLRHSDKDIKDPKYNKDNFSWKKIGLLMLLGVAFVLTGGNALASIAGVLIGIGIVAVSEIYLGRLVAGSR